MRFESPALIVIASVLGMATAAAVDRPPAELAPDRGFETDPALVEHLAPGAASDRKAGSSTSLSDTVWIADWTFDAPGGGCVDAGWVREDLRIENDGSVYWSVDTGVAGGLAAVLRATLNLCDNCQEPLGPDWDQSIILRYSGNATLSFQLWSDTEPGFDFVTVEADSLGMSEARVDYALDPNASPEQFRDVLYVTSGINFGIGITGLALPDYGAGTHEVYIRLETSGPAFECSYPPSLDGLFVDDIVVTGDLAYGEDFECGDASCIDANVQFANTGPATPFGNWGRLTRWITDNDLCTENTTCAWLWSDPMLPAYYPDMAFGPGSAVVRNWLDDHIVSPWVGLAGTSGALSWVLSFRRFPGNRFSQGRIVQGWRVRSRVRLDNTDTPAPGDSFDCVSAWGHASQFNSLNTFAWITSIFDMSGYFDPEAIEIQLSFRVGDWQRIAGSPPPGALNTGPGPYLDRVRIGRRSLGGPAIYEGIDSRTQAQDCFPTYRNAIAPGEHFSPATDRFGTCAFSMAKDLGAGWPGSPNLITGDSITLTATDVRGAGGVTSVKWYGAIVGGPHAGKAPAPYTVGANGFFETTADTMRSQSGVVLAGGWTRDLDDTYFRGGDVLLYFWAATDAASGFSSVPAGLTALPASIASAEDATGGLHEVSFLPAIAWDPGYLARIAAHPTGDIDPTPEEIAGSTQSHCILYYQHVTSRRRSGPLQTTSFMRTLDALGYRGSYDVYDVQGYGNTNNQLGGRATVQQLTGYRLIVEDDGRSNLVPNVTDGSNNDSEKVNQAQLYRNWLAGGAASEVGIATLWLIGENSVYEKSTNPLLTVDCGITTTITDQGLALNPDVEGVANAMFANGVWGLFTGERFSLNGGCPSIRAYDAYTPGGTAVATHVYRTATGTGPAAVVMNSNALLQWNTIAMGFAWFDVRDRFGGAPGAPARDLAAKILNAVLGDCAEPLDPTGVPEGDAIAVPRLTVLHPNVPNPFNPATTLSFDLAVGGRARLEIFDVAGHHVRVALDATLPAAFGHAATWNGLDDAGRRVPSGVYFARLRVDGGVEATRRLVLLK